MGSPALLLNGVYAFVPLLVFLAAAIVALTQRARIPRRATFAALGFGVLFIGDLPSAILSMLFPLLVRSDSYAAYGTLSSVFGVLGVLTLVGGIALLTYTLFVHDQPAPQGHPPQGHSPQGYPPGTTFPPQPGVQQAPPYGGGQPGRPGPQPGQPGPWTQR